MEQIKKVEMFECKGQLFRSEEEAKKHLNKLKMDKIVSHAKLKKVIPLLEEMVTQNLTNKNKINSLIKHLRENNIY